MASRDQYGNIVYGMDQRKERRRKARQAENYRGATIAIVVILLLAIVAAFSTDKFFSSTSRDNDAPMVHEDQHVRYKPISTTDTNDGEVEWFSFRDPETGIVYLVNSLGGCYPRLDRYGNVMGGGYDV